MLKHVTFLGAAAVTALMTTGATAQDVTADTIVATVGDTEITLGEVIIARTQLPPQFAQFPNEVLFEGIIDQLIQQQLLADVLTETPAVVEYTLNNERRSLLAAQVITEIAETSITEADIQAAYDMRFADAVEIEEFNASHLLVETEEEAAAAKARIDEGAAFADVARDVSIGPTGPNGGNLGWFGKGAMVPAFEDQITSLEVGGVSEPFETQFGWHVATLMEVRVQPQPTLEDLRREITAELQEAAITARLEELAAAQTIVEPEAGQFDPNLIDQIDLLD
ncbi:MAG: peptidylprolyl isomerase [Yoonia sp.]|uniref:peptidylprolyl isomerase n=1 Tax=Yoonia sp. TaxID=2212373 RepID=UPI00273E7FAA|nr:peptidylprolyl isomerase [Yoonia sp.]MDP5086762.1 peptidylprolyl isomerase [Yoonia sp.]MDP5362229.1 peptidylprolyl isomerase [Paracoccaceae bacterium]